MLPLSQFWLKAYCRCLCCPTHSFILSSCPNFVCVSIQKLYYDNSFKISGQINLTWNLCTVLLLWPFDLWPWNWPSPWIFCLGHCSEIINGHWHCCFIFSGHIQFKFKFKIVYCTFCKDFTIKYGIKKLKKATKTCNNCQNYNCIKV